MGFARIDLMVKFRFLEYWGNFTIDVKYCREVSSINMNVSKN